MDVALIYQRFLLLAGLPEEQEAGWYSLCEEAAAALKRRLRSTAGGDSPRLILPAAAMAYTQYCLAAATGDDTASFSAGDIRVTREVGGALAAARQLEQNALNEVADLLKDDSFCFQAIGGAP